MSNFPTSIDDDASLPPVNDNLTEIGAEAINAIRDAVFNIESELGLTSSGSTGSVSSRLAVALNPDGTIRASAITGLGLVTLPITQNQIATNAGIPESKLLLDHATQDLYTNILDLGTGISSALGWISATGSKLEPHLQGAIYNHTLSQIEVSDSTNNLLKNKFNFLRDNAQAYNLIHDINSELVTHQQLDGSPAVPLNLVPTLNGGNYPSYYAHTAGGVFLNTQRFSVIPQTAQDLQQFAEFIDSSSIFLYGSRIQNLYSNGISRISRSSSLNADGYGDFIVSETPAIAYLLEDGYNNFPNDDINNGDDIIEFKPTIVSGNNNYFDAKFANVKPGDIVTINYGSLETKFIIKEKKYIQDGINKKYIVRILGKNLFHSTIAKARIDRSLVNDNKFGVLAVAGANNNFGSTPSLIVGSPRGASVLGVGFNPDQLNSSNYLLYLALYTNGNPEDGYTILPAIDVTGNAGTTPGKYSLSTVIESINLAVRQPGYNYRFIAFSYKGEFGIRLADSYNNASFSILNGCVNSIGNFDQAATNIFFKNNVVGIFDTGFLTAPDPLGFRNVASPPYMSNYGSPEAALKPVKLFRPLKRNNYYVNGIEKEKLNLEVGQALDNYGDGYWTATVFNQQIFPSVGFGPTSTGRVETTYRINLDLSSSNLSIGKTLVVQPLITGSLADSGRFIIKDVNFGCDCPDTEPFTDITVYDAVHATGISPSAVLTPSATNKVKIYFNSDSISFNKESSTDFNEIVTPFKRYFEIYINETGQTFTHERSRINVTDSSITINGTVPLNGNSELKKLNIIEVSPKLKGYQFGSVNKITLHVNNYDTLTGIYDGYLAAFNQINLTNEGSVVSGRKGQITRFYDETNIDFIDILFDINDNVNSFSNQNIDFQLFDSLSLDNELMLLSTCQFDELNNVINSFDDKRQFGNTSEKDFSTSAIDFIEAPEKALHGNGVIRGFDLADVKLPATNPNLNQIHLNGGLVLVNGKLIQMNNATVTIPTVKELIDSSLFNINWALCVNDKSEYQCIPLLDFDPELNTSHDITRIFKVYNLVDGTTYNIDASSFSNIVNNRKDLTILYLVASKAQISNIESRLESITINLTISDARKYVNDADTNFPLKLTSDTAQGNFKNPVAILNWIKYNNLFNGNAVIKGSNSSNGTINSAINLNFTSTVTISGENNATLIMNGPVTLGSNLVLKDLTINFNGGLTIIDAAQNLTIENCIINYNAPNGTTHPIFPTTFSTTNDIFVINSAKNITFKDNTLTINYSTPKNGGHLFNIINTSNFVFDNNSATINFVNTLNANFPGDIFRFQLTGNTTISNSVFIGNFNKFLDIVNSSSINLTNLFIESTYNPKTNTPADFNYDSANLVNSGQGWIYANVDFPLDSIFIDNVTFNYFVQNTSDRFSFINFELPVNTSVLSNVSITNCKFNHAFSLGSFDDFRPAVAIVNICEPTTPNTQQPLLKNVNISNNICNRNQSIIITSKTGTLPGNSGVVPNIDVQGVMLYPGLVTQNCAIKNNICGTIGYWVATDSKVTSLPNNVNSFNDKTNGLDIVNNTCHYISNLTSDGYYFLVSKNEPLQDEYVNMSTCPSGFVNISGNKANWIHVGISHDENSSLLINNNTLSAYDLSYISRFKDNSTNSSTRNTSFKYAIFVSSNKHVESNLSPVENQFGISAKSNDCYCVIQNNNIGTGYWLSSVGDPITYKYSLGCIYSQSSCTIQNNICKGVDETGNAGFGILVGGLNNSITQNRIYRGLNSLQAYIGYGNFEGTGSSISIWDGEGVVGSITNNFFDSPFINNVNQNDTTTLVNSLFVPSVGTANFTNSVNWVIEKNKNQTSTAAISLVSGQLIPYGTNGGFQQHTPYNSTFVITPAPCSNLGFQSLVFRIHDESTPGIRAIGWEENLNKYLPNGVTVLEAKMGVRTFSSAVTTSNSPSAGSFNSHIDLFVTSYDKTKTNSANLDYFTSVPPITQFPPYFSGVADTAVSSSFTTQITGSQMNSSFNTITATVTVPSTTSLFTTRLNNVITVSVDIQFQRQNVVDIYISPIVVKYRW